MKIIETKGADIMSSQEFNEIKKELQLLADQVVNYEPSILNPGDALNKYLSGVSIEYRYKLCFTPTPNDWCEVSTAFKWWDDKRFEYRIKI